MKSSLLKKLNLPPLILVPALLAAWEAVVFKTELPPYILPAPSSIFIALAGSAPLLLMHSRVTLSAVLGGLALAVPLAFILALVMDRSRPVKEALYPLLVISQAVPIFALAPLILIWFGAGLLPKVLIVALVCFFPLAVNLVEGLEQTDREALELLQTMQAGRTMVIRALLLPSALPYFFSGLKIAATYSVLGAIIGEWLAARAGLGIYMLRSMHSFRTADLFASIFVVVLLSLALFKLVQLAGWLAMPWQRKSKNQMEG